MNRSEYDVAEVPYLSWIRDYERCSSGGTLSHSAHLMSPACKRRFHSGAVRDSGDDRFVPLSYSPSSFTCRVRKVREENAGHKGDVFMTSNRNGVSVTNPTRGMTSVSCATSVNAWSGTSREECHRSVSPKLCIAHSVNSTPSNRIKEVENKHWPPSSLEVFCEEDDYTEVNFTEYRDIYDCMGPVMFQTPLVDGLKSPLAELRMMKDPNSVLISQNSTQRVVYNAFWLPKKYPNIALKVAVKSVKDGNIRDGRSIKREIGCHLYIYQRIMAAVREGRMVSPIATDDWPTSELLGYYLDKKNPGMSVLVTRKLFGPDFFDIVRSECYPRFASKNMKLYELNKLDWCIIALERIAQISELGIRHNDIKPDNIVLDMHEADGMKRVDVKIIDLGAASMEGTKEFTGGTSWYESPEQKLLEFYTKKHHNIKRAQTVEIDRSSDAWGAGHSIIEVLLGRRMVDYLGEPNGKGAPELIDPPQDTDEPESDRLWWNRDEYWTIPPQLWLEKMRSVLQMDSPSQRFPICAKAARYVYDKLMHVDPRKRESVRRVAEGLRRIARNEIARHL
ncbi:hypothetical protein BgAZ_106390 [Babesia gibsoni]|uniref:Protein kinase domain-containing protein n=1 Tax=Babesia gibsoni TaxID=33632 RepID=A0AAD8UVT0_BABGI|nr:hypothetical protein BgAZ_106390 [Babesia gibsoni]